MPIPLFSCFARGAVASSSPMPTARQARGARDPTSIRPRRWLFGEHQAALGRSRLLLVLPDESWLAGSRAPAGAESSAFDRRKRSGSADADLLRLLDEQVYGRYRAFSCITCAWRGGRFLRPHPPPAWS